MSTRKLTIEQANELRALRARTGGSFAMLGLMYGITRGAVQAIVHNRTYRTTFQTNGWDDDAPPTPHEQLTVAEAARIHREGRWDVPLRSIATGVATAPHGQYPGLSIPPRTVLDAAD
jgi:hypothetical protein